MQNRLDEKIDQLIDSLCISVPKHLNALYHRVARTHIGWHILVFFVSAGHEISAFLRHFSSDEEMDRFLTSLPKHFFPGLITSNAHNESYVSIRNLLAHGLQFRLLLALLALSSVGVVLSPGRDMAAYALSLSFSFLGAAFYLPYRPLTGKFRQTWVEGKLFSAASFLALLLHWFREYLQYGIASNIFMQGAMMISLILHFSFYLATIAFNRRQHVFLRLMDGLTGMLPALAAAAATSLLPSALGGGNALAALICAFGAWLLFLSDRIDSIRMLGGLDLPYASLTTSLFTMTGYILLLISAW